MSHIHAHDDDRAARPLWWALALTLGFAPVEALSGWWANSLALLGDAGHMFSDAVALALAATAMWFGRRPPSARHSYGLVRTELIAALFNGLLMLIVVGCCATVRTTSVHAPRYCTYWATYWDRSRQALPAP